MTHPHAQALIMFDRLVELTEPERNAELQLLAQSSPELAAALDELLRADAASSGVLDRGLQAFATDLEGTLPNVSDGALQPGATMGAFTLLRLIGRGGMGEVWLAERRESTHADAFVQQVALKVLKRGMDSESVSARFMQERKILAELNHPHFAHFIDGGISQDGRLYFAMEYVDGVNLVAHANGKNLNVRERVRLLAEISEAVAYAQNHLVVHRDLKPSNILVDASGAVRVLDFGIAKLLGERAPADTLTHTGVHALSPAYAAPEQVLGESISTATDVYALGAILFELVTGTLPHARQMHSFEALAALVNSEQTPVPSQTLRRSGHTTQGIHSLRALREVNSDLDVIIVTALKREPARRYASAAALADDLRRWLNAMPIAAQLDSRAYRIKKFVARNRLMVGSASTALMALIAGLALALWQAGVAREQARLTQIQLQRAETIKEFTQSLFREQDPFARATAAARTPSELVAIGIQRAQSQFSSDLPVRLELIEDLAGIQVAMGDFDAAAQLLEKVVAQRRAQNPNAPAAWARAQSLYAVALGGLGRFDEGLAKAQEASAALVLNLGANHAESIRAQARTLRLGLLTGSTDQLEAMATDLLARATRVFGASAPETLAIMVDITTIQERADKYQAMQATLRNLLARIERDKGAQHLLLARPLARLADLQRVLQNNAAAMPLFDRAVAIARQNDVKPLLGSLLMRRGDNLRRMGRDDAASADFDESATLLALNSGEWAQLQALRGVLAEARGDFDTAIALSLESQRGFERALGMPSTYSWTSAIRVIALELKRAELKGVKIDADLENRALAAETAMRTLAPPPSFDVFFACGTRAEVLAALGKSELARQRFEEAIKIGSKVYSSEHPEVLTLAIKRDALFDRQHDREARAGLRATLALPGLSKELRAQAEKALAARN